MEYNEDDLVMRTWVEACSQWGMICAYDEVCAGVRPVEYDEDYPVVIAKLKKNQARRPRRRTHAENARARARTRRKHAPPRVRESKLGAF